jgi:hypothetical protein
MFEFRVKIFRLLWIIERTLRVIEMKKFNEELMGMVGTGVRI